MYFTVRIIKSGILSLRMATLQFIMFNTHAVRSLSLSHAPIAPFDKTQLYRSCLQGRVSVNVSNSQDARNVITNKF